MNLYVVAKYIFNFSTRLFMNYNDIITWLSNGTSLRLNIFNQFFFAIFVLVFLMVWQTRGKNGETLGNNRNIPLYSILFLVLFDWKWLWEFAFFTQPFFLAADDFWIHSCDFQTIFRHLYCFIFFYGCSYNYFGCAELRWTILHWFHQK